ncbi:MAG: branched-chain amino acid ABC transporter substrate-binding protein [Spirochaetia bacterium]|nr:branched-chain amino acid ABC transporter substrate-binding protein [Spirochaetota bacterium]MCX8097148.1 branched-chain amino acid ABC transporter substrate-binding protein [Spirochaetota bacterium]MDW8113191.1 branched-chain amino acid ABC transporter substrate-binding protein [Spirochaetia bacterium]
MRKVLGFVCVFVSITILLFVYGCGPVEEGGQKVFKIAVAAPLTGDIATLGQGIKRGVILAHSEFTNNYTNVRVDLEFFDDRANEGEAVNVAEKIASDSAMIGVVGHLNSGCSIPASTVYNRRNLTMITPASTNPKLTLQGYKNVFRVCPTDAQQGPVAAKFIVKRGITKVYIIDDKTEYGQGIADEFEKEFKKLGGVVLGRDSVSVGARNFKALLTKIKQTNPQAVFFGGVYVEGALLTKQADEVGLNVPFVGGDGLKTDEYVKLAGSSANGDIITFIGSPLDENSDFYRKYKQSFPNDEIGPFDYNSYLATKILLTALTNLLKEGAFSREGANSFISKTEFSIGNDVIKFNENGDNINSTFTVYVINNGKFEIAEIIR